jgi:lysophospholipid acyltransferase (LPLAT)-like uncharacterized protein
MFKKIWRSAWLQASLGNLLALYLGFVRRTTSFVVDPPNGYAYLDDNWPAILALWHGQHFMVPFGRRPGDRYSVLISSHGDGELNAIAAEKLGIGLIRGSGAQRPDQIVKRGGAKALRLMLDHLDRGISLTLTADVPKVSRVAGPGIVTLARLSGRAIVPVAVITKNRLTFGSWDAASLPLPFFNRGVIGLGEPIHVPREADKATLELLRRQVEIALDEVHARAYARVGSSDHAADRIEVALGRAAAAERGLREASETVAPIDADGPGPKKAATDEDKVKKARSRK